MYGHEDRLLNKLAGVTNLFTANHMQQRFRPVHVCNMKRFPACRTQSNEHLNR